MAVETEQLSRLDLEAAAKAAICQLRVNVAGGRQWYEALLETVAKWPLPQEVHDGRLCRYLIGGEAFDWLLLAERLLDEIEDLVPEAERVNLIFRARPPIAETPESFRDAIGPWKHRAHLNYVYGVTVEEALQLAVEEDLHKELRCGVWGSDRRVDENVYQRIYGRSREALLATFRQESGQEQSTEIALGELREFTYWLFKYRMHQSDPARMASDTRRGLAQISRMEAQQRARDFQPEPEAPDDFIEGYLAAED